ncbi:5-amino-6-(5-phospho-D-ribitylamino)uracil phosphatase, chloroplastic-like isoform X1 [Papaver somniferum]|uniref:5-amino-6-(5-phospho-D-ribitylamino)uracil phosphatase, chloroplastic-like isoform X1 n=1 Tax=Papaver somniferum TaxID=3469 RepID=UPI000E6FE0B4|nr:5-amino-6-(5-phospho-D-ribitylamino)uracil phosphatase, chloroplastic-like isoform X1 [Papaver somniferum]
MESCKIISTSPIPKLRLPEFPTTNKPKSLKLHRQNYNIRRHRIITRASSSSGSDENGFSPSPSRVFREEEAIGAEYGEGFETFRPDGPLKIDVDFLNDRMQEGFLQRIRYAMKPDEAFGLIFSWDNVVADTRTLKLNAWEQLASEEGKNIPGGGTVEKSLLYASADHVLRKVLSWENEDNEVERLKSRLSELYFENLLKVRSPNKIQAIHSFSYLCGLKAPIEGVKEWLDAVSTARVPCAIVSCLDRRTLVEALKCLGLTKYFQAIVTEEDGMDSVAHRFLSAAVKLDRKPSKCVVFEDDPRGIVAAHNCTMMAVALIGVHPAYELVQADLAVGSFNELSVINLRRLFAHKGSTFMELQKQGTEKTPTKRKLTIDTIF